MINLTFDFAVIGGDDRLAYIAIKLNSIGYKVITYCLDIKDKRTDVKRATSLTDAMYNSKILICPIPFTCDDKTIFCTTHSCSLLIEEFKNNLLKNHYLFAGCIPKEIVNVCNQKNISVYDYMKNDKLAIYNSIATAEGAIAEAVINQPTNIHFSKCLVLGFGKCAKTLASKLKGLSANVSICARDQKARAEANSYGYDSLDFIELGKRVKDFEYIFNTVPALVIDKNILKAVNEDVFILDITKKGVDMKTCKDKNINAKVSLGIPGRFAPKASADALINLTLKAINEN